MAKLFKM